MKTIAIRLPVFPNWFPYNDMLLDGHLEVGECEGVKTRSWSWDYRGSVLLYNSGRTAHAAAKAYGYKNNVERHKVIVGVAELADVRELTEDESLKMICNFNNITLEQAEAGDYEIGALPIGFFFRHLRRFEQSVPFRWPAGPVKPIFTNVISDSELANQLRKTSS